MIQYYIVLMEDCKDGHIRILGNSESISNHKGQIQNLESSFRILNLLDKQLKPYAANHDQVQKQLYLKTKKKL